ncbi:hypothetical protein GXB85_05405 [Cellulomonas sp. APG4]|uniref:hypothetical protein n=1 Tax=Cellulomonas sp. APG4 TaxID=1538656 RepID=UPI001379A3CD|nr:hypothetical protein [Cellulomonas sp. APG4]NCT90388.1 hypothetical protein [Cellulomonas sp. APG4]
MRPLRQERERLLLHSQERERSHQLAQEREGSGEGKRRGKDSQEPHQGLPGTSPPRGEEGELREREDLSEVLPGREPCGQKHSEQERRKGSLEPRQERLPKR